MNIKDFKNLTDVLKNQDKDALIKVLLDYAQKDEQINQDLLYRFTGRNLVSYARNIIQTSIKRVMRRDFIEYKYVKEAMSGANEILEMAENMVDDVLPCLSVCPVIFEEILELYNKCDNIIELEIVLARTTVLIEDVVAAIPDDFTDIENAFDFILDCMRKTYMDGVVDWKNDLLHSCVPLCRVPNVRKKFENYLLSIKDENKYIKEDVDEILCDIRNK